jgi:hypothetical protein
MKARQLRPKNRGEDNPFGGLRSLTGDPSTDSALWELSLLLEKIAKTNKGKEDGQLPAPSFEEAE